MIRERPVREEPTPLNRMEPLGPNRYLKTDTDIREYMQKDRKIVSSILVASAEEVLKNTFQFSDEQVTLFREELQKEIAKE